MSAVIDQTDADALAAEARTRLLRVKRLNDGSVAALYRTADSVVIVPAVTARERTGRLVFDDSRAAELAFESLESETDTPPGAVPKG